MIEGIVGGVVALGGYAWYKHHQRNLKLQEAKRQEQMDQILNKGAPEFVKELIFASSFDILEQPELAAKWREAALKRLKIIYAGEVCNIVRPGFSKEFVLKVGEVLSGADVTEETRMRAAMLLNQLTVEVKS